MPSIQSIISHSKRWSTVYIPTLTHLLLLQAFISERHPWRWVLELHSKILISSMWKGWDYTGLVLIPAFCASEIWYYIGSCCIFFSSPPKKKKIPVIVMNGVHAKIIRVWKHSDILALLEAKRELWYFLQVWKIFQLRQINSKHLSVLPQSETCFCEPLSSKGALFS